MRSFALSITVVLSASFVLVCNSFSHIQTENSAIPTPAIVRVTVAGLGLFGGDAGIVTHIFKPAGKPPFPVLVFSHGRAGDAASRSKLTHPIPIGHVGYWLNKGYAVVAPIRPGYGETGGPDRENSGARYDTYGRCASKADHENTTRSASEAMTLVIDWVRTQPWINPNQILLEGQSVGGITTVALCAANLPGVVGCINFSGGSGGSPSSMGKVCNPEVIDALMLGWGKTTRLPSVWLYAPNDSYWGADTPKVWHRAFAAGASASLFVGTDPLPDADGHSLLVRGGSLWKERLDTWLSKNGF